MQNDPHATPERPKLKRKEYEEKLLKLQIELCKLLEWVRHKALRVVVIFEGRDAAGKGGAIKAITERALSHHRIGRRRRSICSATCSTSRRRVRSSSSIAVGITALASNT